MMLNRALFLMLLSGLLFSALLRAGDDIVAHEDPVAIAKEFARQQRFDEALFWYKKAAEQGSIEALYIVGIAEIKGVGVEKNPLSGLLKIQSSADKGLSVAQFSLGYLYQKGKLGAVDYDKARYWYHVAAKQNFSLAEVALGSLYAKGQGVKQNFAAAETWYRKAYKQGSIQGGFNLAVILFKQASNSAEFDQALQIFHSLAESDHISSQLVLSRFYLNGKPPEVEASQEKAIFWLQKAAGKGSANAQLSLGSLYLKGGLLPANGELAFYWLNKAALQGEVQAQLGLASAFLTGDALPRDLSKAYMWISVASASGNVKATEFKSRLEQVLSAQQQNKALLAAKDVLAEIHGATRQHKEKTLEQPFEDEEVGLSI